MVEAGHEREIVEADAAQALHLATIGRQSVWVDAGAEAVARLGLPLAELAGQGVHVACKRIPCWNQQSLVERGGGGDNNRQ